MAARSPKKKQKEDLFGSGKDQQRNNDLIAAANAACEENDDIFTPLLDKMIEDLKKTTGISKMGIVSPLISTSSFFY